MHAFAFVFPGQGSQSVGMLDAWGDHPAVRQTLAEAAAALGEDIGALIHGGPKEALELTTNTQPVMLTAAIACYNAWRAEGGAEPAAVAGHSLGEYSALVAAGALTLADALPLVRLRARAMQQAVPVGAGAMAAILGLDAAAVGSDDGSMRMSSGASVAYENPRSGRSICMLETPRSSRIASALSPFWASWPSTTAKSPRRKRAWAPQLCAKRSNRARASGSRSIAMKRPRPARSSRPPTTTTRSRP